MNFIKRILLRVFNKAAVESNKSLGFDIFDDNPFLNEQLQQFIHRYLSTVDGLPKEKISRLSEILEKGACGGMRFQKVGDDLEKLLEIPKEQAWSIARNFTARFNAFLSQIRQQEAGITEYRWQTAGDERVRHSHKVLDGKLCRWDNPRVYFDENSKKWVSKTLLDGDPFHPGENENCRCVAIAHIEGIT